MPQREWGALDDVPLPRDYEGIGSADFTEAQKQASSGAVSKGKTKPASKWFRNFTVPPFENFSAMTGWK
jgi:hypothetical protein